ncbi:MAG: ComF family protein [Alistipes sp.]|nr:ComF family protein [Alistipes sp.]
MSIFKSYASALVNLMVPRLCPVCHVALDYDETLVCRDCREHAPVTGFCRDAWNPMVERLEAFLPVYRAAALLWYNDGGRWRRIIHHFKYEDKWYMARLAGEWLGEALDESELFADVDKVIPVPLHWRKRISRGYNQSEYIAAGVASVLGAEADFRSVRRKVNNPSQTLNSAMQRWNNVDGIFEVRNPDALRGRHILLVDDVFTTGATVVSCADTILRSTGIENVKISVATFAVARKLVDIL